MVTRPPQISHEMDFPETKRPRDYMEALEEERRKILVFQRELPLCLQLVSQAIESCRHQVGGEVSSGPVLEEFIPLKPSSSSESGHGGDSSNAVPMAEGKPDWLRSVQLWSHDPDQPLDTTDVVVRKPVAVSVKKLGGAFHPFEKEKMVPPPPPAASSTAETTAAAGGDWSGESGAAGEKEKESQSNSHRKARRCWSPELHRRFLHALQQLGGSHAATPKQIREQMKVDGLTNDEVKSHLQKYRLHTRRPTPTAHSSSSSGSPQAPQFVLVGGIWVPPPEYPAAAAAVLRPSEGLSAPLPGAYIQVASLPPEFIPQHQIQDNKSTNLPTGPLHSEGRCSQDDSSLADDGAAETASPTSSTSQTPTTTSPPFP